MDYSLLWLLWPAVGIPAYLYKEHRLIDDGVGWMVCTLCGAIIGPFALIPLFFDR
jgi:hypothetical protein